MFKSILTLGILVGSMALAADKPKRDVAQASGTPYKCTTTVSFRAALDIVDNGCGGGFAAMSEAGKALTCCPMASMDNEGGPIRAR